MFLCSETKKLILLKIIRISGWQLDWTCSSTLGTCNREQMQHWTVSAASLRVMVLWWGRRGQNWGRSCCRAPPPPPRRPAVRPCRRGRRAALPPPPPAWPAAAATLQPGSTPQHRSNSRLSSPTWNQAGPSTSHRRAGSTIASKIKWMMKLSSNLGPMTL